MNRYLYFYHESLHIYQGIRIGDQINKLKDDLQAWDVYDPQKEIAFIKENSTDAPDIEKQEWIDKSIFFLPDESKDGTSDYWILNQVANNEATMNALQEQALQPQLREQPALVLWLHNTISFQVEGLRTLKTKLLSGEIEKKTAQDIFNKLEGSLPYVYDIYFAIADNSQEVESFLINIDPNTKYLNRGLEGSIARTESFDRFYLFNILLDIKTLLRRFITSDALKEYKFPSGESHFKENDARGPMTLKGADLLSDIIAAGAERGYSSKTISIILEKIQSVLNGVNEDPKLLAEVYFALESDLGLKYSEDDLRELYDAGQYMYYDELSGDYTSSYRFVLRKKVIEKLQKVAPGEVNLLIRNIFFETALQFDQKSFAQFTGLATKEPDSSYKARAMEEVAQERSLGIMNIDMVSLDEESKAKIVGFLDRYDSEWHNTIFQNNIIETMTNIAKTQKGI